MYLIVGLGNPEEKYAGTRHNLGFEVLDEFVRKHVGSSAWGVDDKFKAEIIKTNYQQSTVNCELILARPQTYMNLSGLAVSKIASYYKIPPENIVIIHDELDLPLGHIKMRIGGAAAGHHGVESVIDKLGVDKFIRIRLGIGNLRSQSSEHGGQSFNVEHYVLDSFLPNEKSTVKRMIKEALKAINIFLEKGLEKAQHQFN